MERLKKGTISAKLFKTYSLVFSLLFTFLFLVAMGYIGLRMNADIVQTQEQILSNINKNIENYFLQVEDFSLTLMNSKEFKNTAIQTLPEAYRRGEPVGSYFNELYLTANKMIPKGYMVGVYSKSGDYIWMGSNYFIEHLNRPEYLELVKNRDFIRPEIQVMEKNQMLSDCLAANPYCEQDLVKVISFSKPLSRSFRFAHPDAILDIQIPYEDFDSLMEGIVSGSRMKVSLYNSGGMRLYGEDGPELDDYRVNGAVAEGRYRTNGNLVQVQSLFFNNLYLVSSIGVSDLYGSLFLYIVIAFAAILVLNFLLLFVTYRVSVRITSPIQRMCGQIENFGFDSGEFQMYQPVQTDIQELDLLSGTIVRMQEKLKSSMEEIICLRSYEVQSKLLALQAQMQPHFLFNTLMNIAAMAEERENDEVARTCYSLTRMLRYISSDNADSVTLTEEISHLEDYILIMKERFPETEVEYKLPLALMGVKLPKLVIQPLVENSLKYCDRPDCRLVLTGRMCGEGWRISVQDNGPGFSGERIGEIMERCERAFQHYRTDSLQINGMGLANIYIRLRLFYGEKMYFRISNNEGHGCCIEIGGSVERGQ